jgi:hypothetical protein
MGQENSLNAARVHANVRIVTHTYSNADEVLDAVWDVIEFGSFTQRPKVDSVGAFGSQPLKVVVTWGDVRAVELLLDAGAPVNAKHEGGDTALHHAIRMANFGLARLLIGRGANQTIRNDEGKLPRDLCWTGEWEGLGLTVTDIASPPDSSHR